MLYAYGFNNDVCFTCSALVSPRGFNNNKNYMRMALRTTYISCVARLFRLVTERFFLSFSPTDFRWVRLTLARTNCLHRIRSSLFANILNPSLLIMSFYRHHRSSALRPFRFRRRSDSIRLRVKTTRLRSGVLDICEIACRSFCSLECADCSHFTLWFSKDRQESKKEL